MDNRPSVSQRIADFLDRRSGWFLVAVVAVSGLLVIPLATMASDEQASDNPGGTVYDLADSFSANLPPRFHGAFFVAEAVGDDFLTQEPLLELYQNTQQLRQADRDGRLTPPELPEQEYLFNGFDVDRQQPILGVFTVADAVQEALALHPRLNTSLAEASDEEVKFALHLVFGDPRTDALKVFLSEQKQVERRTVLGQEIDYWTSPALEIGVAADNDKLGGGGMSIGATSDPITLKKEHFNRKVQALLRGAQESYRLWGVAIDAGLEIEDEVAAAVPFIMATFIMVLVVMGFSLRSIRVVFLAALGLGAMIIWLKGLSNLAGLASSTTLDFIVPIAMISLGADFTIHAVSRYREERRLVPDARRAFRTGMAGVFIALTLAMATDAIAFLSNASADIETVVGFGVGAALAILAAYIIMDLAVPVALMRLDARRAASAVTGAAPEPSQPETRDDATWRSLPALVVMLARRRLIVLPLVALVTAAAGYYAFQLEATFDVKDFFKSDSDFAVGLDKVDVYVGESGGESATVYIEGDLTDPSALLAIQELLELAADNPYVAKNDEGEASLQARPIFSLLEQVVASDYARSQIEEISGVSISTGDDLNEFRHLGEVYRWPNSSRQLSAIYDYIAENGVPLSPTQSVYDALDVGQTLFHDPAGGHPDATAIDFGIPGTREQTNTIASREALAEDIRVLEAAPSISLVGLTGSPYTRQAALDATTDGLQRALIIAAVACLLVAIVVMRSLFFGIVTIIPIGLVVTWLYALMYGFGFGLNFITATIAAVSIGVGIDYAIHMTQRYREELGRAKDKDQALHRAAQGTGVALLASAATSIIGFAIMAFAPMPMFSSYGILTAIMIFLAVAASLLVLPSLLFVVTPSATEDSRRGARA